MTYPYPPDGRCWTCNKKRKLTWFVRGLVGCWLCARCQREA